MAAIFDEDFLIIADVEEAAELAALEARIAAGQRAWDDAVIASTVVSDDWETILLGD